MKTCCDCGVRIDRHSTRCLTCAGLYRSQQRPRHTPYEYTKRARAVNPDHKWVYQVVYRAVKAGALKRQPCEYCGDVEVQAHHDDYSKPLVVRWLCAECHRALHRAMKAKEVI